MRVNTAAALAIAGGVAGLAACSPPHPMSRLKAAPKTISALTCPQEQGELKLQGAASPTLCTYVDDQGARVKLQLVALNGMTAEAALAPFQQAAETEVPQLAANAQASGAGASASTSASADNKVDNDHDRADIDLPGIHIHANGDNANVDVAGVHVHSDDTGEHRATVTGRMNHDRVLVNANDGGARIHVDEDGAGVRTIFMLAGKTPGPNGWRLAGYEARGPSTGPLVVATMLANTEHHDELRQDIGRLLTDNVGKQVRPRSHPSRGMSAAGHPRR